MDSASEALLIIVSATLSVFLVVCTIALVKIIKIVNHLQKLTEKAEQIADKAEAVGEFFQKTAGPAAIAKLLGNIAQSFKDKDKSK